MFFNGLAHSFVQGCLFGFASMFPTKYMIIMLMSQSIAGIVINFLKIFCVLILPPDNSKGAEDMNVFYNSIICVGFGILLLLICIACFNYIYQLEYAQYYLNKANRNVTTTPASQPSFTQNTESEDESVHVGRFFKYAYSFVFRYFTLHQSFQFKVFNFSELVNSFKSPISLTFHQ